MIRKTNSRSFVTRQNLPPTLPPLQKNVKSMDETAANKDLCPTTRPTFIIRKRNSSFMQTYTNRQQDQSQVAKQNQPYKLPKSAANDTFKKYKISSRQTKNITEVSNKDDHKQLVSICNLEVQQFVNLKDMGPYFQPRSSYQPTQIVYGSPSDSRSVNTAKESTKKAGKKRKIQQCKTRKIIWGPKREVLDLAISAIKLNQQNIPTPLESLHQLYIQIL